MAHQANLLPLKVLVISLGMVLIGGTIFVFASIAHKVGKETASANCPDATLHLAGKGTVTSITPQGDKIQVTLAQGQQIKVLTVDRCTGAALNTLTIAP